jgi:hypothetical protein
MATVSFVDETTAGERHEAWHLEIFEERITLREVIRRRIFQEVAEHNAKRPEAFRGLVQPDAARRSQGTGLVDAEEQFDRAVKAFGRNGFLVLVDDRQVEDLDAELDLGTRTEISFLKLIPLVGG